MVKIYGYSDDIVVVEGSSYEFDEIGCFNSNVIIWFTDGTAIRVEYDGCWHICVGVRGSAEAQMGLDFSKSLTDVFRIDAEIKRHEVIDRRL